MTIKFDTCTEKFTINKTPRTKDEIEMILGLMPQNSRLEILYVIDEEKISIKEFLKITQLNLNLKTKI